MDRARVLGIGMALLVGLSGAAIAAPAGDRHFVVGSGSQVSYHVKAKIAGLFDEAIDGVNSEVRGDVRLALGHPAGWAEADVTAFKSGIKGRDRHVAQILGFPKTPTVRFDLTDLLEFDPSLPAGKVTGVGTLTANGTSRPLRLPLQYQLQGPILRIEGEAPLRFADFGIAPPVMGLGLKRAPDDLVIRVRLVATEDHPS
ncbi:MAG TPA: YceI family protein [Stenomitos sp.]